MAATPGFRSAEEFVELMDRVFTMMSEDPEVGPRLRDADAPQRMELAGLRALPRAAGGRLPHLIV